MEKSCGAIIFNEGKVLVVKQTSGFYGFPKGHVEIGETEKETHARVARSAWGGGLREYGSIFTDQFHTGDCAAYDAP